MELKPFIFEREIPLEKDFTLTLTLDYSVIAQLETLYDPRSILDLLGELPKVGSVMTQFLFFMTRKHHPDLSHDVIAGIQYSKKHGTVVLALLGAIMKDAFNLKPATSDG
jgi:hypothetical protein